MILISNYVKGAQSTAKVYLASMTQNGTDAPTVELLNSEDKNFLGELDWVRESAGQYSCTSELFSGRKVFVNGLNPFTTYGGHIQPPLVRWASGPAAVDVYIFGTQKFSNKILIHTLDNTNSITDNVLSNYSILIEIIVFD